MSEHVPAVFNGAMGAFESHSDWGPDWVDSRWAI